MPTAKSTDKRSVLTLQSNPYILGSSDLTLSQNKRHFTV